MNNAKINKNKTTATTITSMMFFFEFSFFLSVGWLVSWLVTTTTTISQKKSENNFFFRFQNYFCSSFKWTFDMIDDWMYFFLLIVSISIDWLIINGHLLSKLMDWCVIIIILKSGKQRESNKTNENFKLIELIEYIGVAKEEKKIW